MECRIAKSEDAALADPEEVDGFHAGLLADMPNAVVEIAVDVVLKGEPLIGAVGMSPIDRVNVEALIEEITDEGTIFLKIGDGVAADESIAQKDGWPYRRGGCALVSEKLNLIAAKHLALGRRGDLDILVFNFFQELETGGDPALVVRKFLDSRLSIELKPVCHR
jgi:hypothetical protein